MARLRMLELDEMAPEVRARAESREAAGLRGVARIEAYQPEVAALHEQMGIALGRHGGLDQRLVELVRIRIAFHNQCRTCMSVRYSSAFKAGFTEDLVCSLERPEEAEDLTDAERAALRYTDLFATDHLAIDDAVHDDLRRHFTERQIVALGYLCGMCVGFGRMAATWDVVEALPEGYRAQEGTYTPWGAADPVLVGRPRPAS
jgi:AhpD family alkylhydroperoxidase